MTIGKRSLSLLAAVALGVASAWIAAPLSAQGTGEDFLFHQPKVTLSFALGYGMPTAGSDLFTEVQDLFTLEKSDFNAPVIAGGLSFYLNDRMDIALEFSYQKSSTWSEYVDWVDNNDLPIEQETHFTRVPVTASFRYFLMDRGQEIGSLSWIPTTWTPYVGAGGGRIFYEFKQEGDFVDFYDYSIFSAMNLSEGWAWVGHIFGGVQWALSPQWILNAEARYSLADADLDRPAYVGYEPIDLSGFQAMMGFGIRF